MPSNTYTLKVLETNWFRSKVFSDLMTLQDQYQHHLFHLTITWISNLGTECPDYLNQTLTRFYLQELCPYLLQVHRVSKFNRQLQPTAIAFIESGTVENKNQHHPGNCALLHHHILLAATGQVSQRLLSICGQNTLKKALLPRTKTQQKKFRYVDLICTSDLKQITNPVVQIPYASKDLWASRLDSTLRFNYPVPWEDLRHTKSLHTPSHSHRW